jgi:SAM-dependent methyltransferase
MAKIEFVHPAANDSPSFTEIVEVRVWGVTGAENQVFYLGGGVNFQGNANLWLEVIYSVGGAQIFYTRNFLHQISMDDPATAEAHLDEILEKGEGAFVYCDYLPETRLGFTIEKFSYPIDDEVHEGSSSTLEISADTSSVFGRSSPGTSSIDIQLKGIDQAQGAGFMRQLIHEIEEARQSRHPDPASFPEGSSEWPFIGQLNRRAYDHAAEKFYEPYFKNPLLTAAFDGWLDQLPPGGSILDAGCGHGDPVIPRLLQKGFQVTGTDFSPEMLRRARLNYPQVEFIQNGTTEISHQAAFDGACSFNAMLYLDPIDLLNSIHRLHRALKPGGLLFLYGYDNGPDWRGDPFSHTIGQWMWNWHYGMEEAANLLEEHGYFSVLDACKVLADPAEERRLAEARKKQKKDPSSFVMPFIKMPIAHTPYAYVITARRRER